MKKVFILLALLCSGNFVYANEVIFSDDFNRPDSDMLGNPNIGGAWVEANESLATDVSTSLVRKTLIKNSSGKMDIMYDVGDPFVQARHVYTYANLTEKVSFPVDVSFDFIPHESARVQHEIALIDSDKGYYQTVDGVGQPLYFPVDGIAVYIGRTNTDYNNSQIVFYTYANGVRTVHRPVNRMLPFQLMPDVLYHVDFSVNIDGVFTTVISGGGQTAIVSEQIPSLGLAGLNLDQISLTDNQGAGYSTNVHHTYFDNVKVISGPVNPPEENDYPLYTQIISEHPSIAETTSWANDPFAGGAAGSRCPTIAACGCTITSTMMLARSYGITRGIDGTDVNPGNFNRWLTANNGYRPGGNLDFSQAIKYFGIEENGVKKSYFIFKDAPLSGAAVKQRVSAGVPVVSQMSAKFRRNSEERGSHFVLVTKQLGAGKYGVNDPIWYNTENLDDDVNRESWVQDYNDQIVNGRDLTFTATPVAVTSALSATLVGRGSIPAAATFLRTTALLVSGSTSEVVTAPVEMFLVTPNGSRLGSDPRTGQNFTLATGYYGTESFLSDPLDETAVPVTDVLKALSASELTSGTHRVVVVGTGSGSYVYSGLVHDAAGHEHPFSFTGETAKGMVDVYTFDVTTGEVKVALIDKELFSQILDQELPDKILNRFFKMWADKIWTEIANGKIDQARQHIETFRTLMKAKKVTSPALELLLKKLEAQIG